MTTLQQLSTWFHMRRGQTPGAWALPLRLPGLLGCWAPVDVDNLLRISGLLDVGGSLTRNGDPTIATTTTAPGVLVPYVDFDGAGDYYNRADEAELSPTGDITVVAWVYLDVNNALQGVINKWEDVIGNNRSYRLYVDATGKLTFEVSEDGGAVNMAQAVMATALSTATWYMAQGRFEAGVSTDVRVDDGSWVTDTSNVLTGCHDSGRDFEVGRDDENAARCLDGRMTQWSLYAYAEPTAVLDWAFREQAPLLGRI